MKCIPTTFSGLFVAEAMALIGKRGCVAGQDGVRRTQPVKLCEGLLLDSEVFGHGLDDQVCLCCVLKTGGKGDSGHCGRLLFGASSALVNATLQAVADGLHPFSKQLIAQVHHGHRVASFGNHLGYAIAHGPCS